MVKHMTRTQLEDYREILKHILRDPDLLVNAAARRNVSLFDAYTTLLDDLAAVEERIALVDKQEGVKA